MVLSTQNPVDLDYKAMSNAGTWLIGRLQTERDKARVLEGMRSAAGSVDIDALDTMIGGLGQRQFLLHTSRGSAPRRFTTRWAMSFLRGPLTRIEVERLTQDDPERVMDSGAAVAAASRDVPAHHASADDRSTRVSGHDQVAVAPVTPAGVAVRYLDPGAPWAAGIGADPGGTALAAAVAARVHLRYDDTAAGLDHAETYECIFFPLTEDARPEDAHVVDYDDRDLRAEPPPNATYTLPPAPIDSAAYFRSLEKRLADHLYRTRTTDVFVNSALDLYSRVGETRTEFVERCRSAGAERADADAAKLRDRVQAKLDRLGKQQQTAEDRVRELTVDSKQRVQQELVAGAGQLLSMFLGGQRNVRALSGAASRRGITRRTQERLDTAKGKVDSVADEMRDIEQDLAGDLAGIQEKWDACADDIEVKPVPLERNDITVEDVVLLWVPAPGRGTRYS
jgi:hypothetical protein